MFCYMTIIFCFLVLFYYCFFFFFFFFQAEDGIRDVAVTGVQTCALPISSRVPVGPRRRAGALGVASGARAAPRDASAADDGLLWRIGCHGVDAGREIGRASCREKSVDLGGRRM